MKTGHHQEPPRHSSARTGAPPSEEAKWRRLRYITLALTTVAVVWLLTLCTILVVRSGDTVDSVLGLVEHGQQQRSVALQGALQQAQEAEATARRELAQARRTAAEATERAQSTVRDLRAEVATLQAGVREERSQRQALAADLLVQARQTRDARLEEAAQALASADLGLGDARALLERVVARGAADAATARAALDDARARLGTVQAPLRTTLGELSALEAWARQHGQPPDAPASLRRRLQSLQAEVARAIQRLEQARGRLGP